MKIRIKNLPGDFINLIYPRVCLVCGDCLFVQEELICTSCLYLLPKTGYHFDEANNVAQLFWGRIPIEAATAYYYFSKGNKVQRLLHQLKYNGYKDLGVLVGKLMGPELISSPLFENVDVVIPVPLHPKKEQKRGFNQSEQFAAGLAESIGIKLDTQTLIRRQASSTQTKKSRFKRWENVESIFDVTNLSKLANQHILLVDDVITTGSTLEACALALSDIPAVKISIAGIAFTSR